ncbi:beta-1,3-galactosyltransferase 5-like [Penaeus japonicus]|uniref:beta-1,3-galactosyltransferase 5-like n=1 Tax=Penaeus japonicus TaxID=27405 RepID=UPI001C70B15E|nr:beta-1,3-galactosyltransferase 5-like [Penaeus japonicus]
MLRRMSCLWSLLIRVASSVMATVPRVRLCCQPAGLLFLCASVGVFVVVRMWENLVPIAPALPPTPLSASPLYPSRLPLLDLHDFSYVINNDVCGRGSDVFTVVIVHTHPANREVRDIMRTQIPQQDLQDLGVRRVFLLARAEWQDQALYHQTPQADIDRENVQNQDIVQGNFKEHYHNLTYKHVMGLQWVTRYCPQVKYIIKMDDDIAVDLYQFRDLLKYRYRERTNVILGLLQVEARPVRNKQSKWYVSETEFPGKFYAPFMSGWAYAMSLDAARLIVAESSKVPYFWIDDVHVTGTLAERSGVKREGLNRFYTLHVDHLYCCIELPDHAEYLCDFLAGPSEGDTNVMTKVLGHARFCYVNTCYRRPPEHSVSKMCVRTKLPPLAPLGKGRGEIVRVYR